MDRTVRLEGHISLEQARGTPYLYLPFTVPAGAQRIEVAYGYSDPVTAPLGMGPGNAVDIGVFDSRGYEFPQPDGFRGWSGTSRREFFIATDEATPGYIRGPLFPGEWNIILGVARAKPEGLRYEVTVKLTEAPAAGNLQSVISADPRPAHPALPAYAEPLPAHPEVSKDRAADNSPPSTSPNRRWLKGDLHCHTLHSDGLNTVEEIVQNAIDIGLDFLAVTDHNTNTHHEELDRLSHLPIILIPGEEITTYWGHANTWGLREWIEFRCADEDSMAAVQQYVHRQGAMISINHAKCVGPPWLFQGWNGYQSMEVWQAPWRFYNWESLERWEALLKAGERVVAVGGSDVHSIPPAPPRHPHGLANPTTWVWVEDAVGAGFKPAQPRVDPVPASLPARPEALVGRTERFTPEQAILDAIRKGHVFLSDAPSGAHLILTADTDGDGRFETMMGDTLSVRPEALEGRRADGPTRFRVQVHGSMDRRLWIIADGQPFDIIPLDTVNYTHEFSLDLAGRRYVRAELRGYRGRPERGEVIWAMTNPIWTASDYV